MTLGPHIHTTTHYYIYITSYTYIYPCTIHVLNHTHILYTSLIIHIYISLTLTLTLDAEVSKGNVPVISDAHALALAVWVEQSRSEAKQLGGSGIWNDCKQDWRGFGNAKRTFGLKDGASLSVETFAGKAMTFTPSSAVDKKTKKSVAGEPVNCKVIKCERGASGTYWRVQVVVEGDRHVTGDVSIFTHPSTKVSYCICI